MRKGPNEYNTTDPSTLLRLKRQEAEAMLNLVRSVNPQSPKEDIIEKVVDTIRRQLGVEKLMVVLRNEKKQHILEVNYNFGPPPPGSLSQLDAVVEITDTRKLKKTFMQELGVEYIIPLGTDKKEPKAWIMIADFADTEAEVMNDLVFIETVGTFMVISIENIVLFHEKQRQALIQNELDVASRIQQESLPSDFDLIDELDIYARCIAHYKVAGDFYDLVILDEDELFLCIADAAGKGIAAAMLVANIQANLRALIEMDASYYVILHRLHQAIAKLTHNEKFVTIFFAKLNTTTRQMEYVNAGHNPPFLLKKDGELLELSKGSIPLGILPIETYEVGFCEFAPGDILFAYSDGVVEQENAEGDLLGTQAIQQLLRKQKDYSSEEIVIKVLDLLEEHSQGVDHSDDVSMMVVRYKD